MIIEHLYMREKEKQVELFIVNKDKCDQCEKPLAGFAVHYINPRFTEKVFCFKCIKDLNPIFVRFGQPEFRQAMVVYEIPKGAYPILAPTPIVTHRYTNLQEAEKMKAVKEAKVIDKTKRVGQIGYTLSPDAQIGKSESQMEIEESWKEDPLKVLDFHMNAEPTKELDEKKQKRLL